MKATQLNEAMGYIDDKYLDMAEAPKKEIMEMATKRNRKTIGKALLVAAMVMMLAITAYATDFMNVKTLMAGTGRRYQSFAQLDQAMGRAGFQMEVRERFANGYAFESMSVDDTHALDENGKQVFTYRELWVSYRNAAGHRLTLIGHEALQQIPHTNSPAVQTRRIGDTEVSYTLDHYRFVPEDYTPTEEDKLWMEMPGNYMSYGAEEMEETDVGFLTWTKDGIDVTIMDMDAGETPEALFAMAEELIHS